MSPRPSQDPKRIEVRILHAVDRAGYRFTLRRQRGHDELLMYADTGGPKVSDTSILEDAGASEAGVMTGRLIDSLTNLMEATPVGERVD